MCAHKHGIRARIDIEHGRDVATSSGDPPHRESMKIESMSVNSHPLAIANNSSQLSSDFHPDGARVLTSAINMTLPIIEILPSYPVVTVFEDRPRGTIPKCFRIANHQRSERLRSNLN